MFDHMLDMEYMGDGRVYGTDRKGITRNMESGQIVTRVWVYPVKQAVIGGLPETYYFGSIEDQNKYYNAHDYCDKLPRCKKYSDYIITPEQAEAY